MTGTGLQTAPDTVDVFDDASDDALAGDINGRAWLRDLPPAEAGLPAHLVAAVAVAVYP
jgi:4'-phosphopantetheinyl transferase